MSKITGKTKISELLFNDEENLEHKDGQSGDFDPNKHPRDPKTGQFIEAIGGAVRDISKGAQDVATEASKLPYKKGTTQRGTYPELSDAELQKRVNRMNLEQRYSDLRGDTKYVKSGEEKARETLQTIGATAGIISALTPLGVIIGEIIAARIKKKHG